MQFATERAQELIKTAEVTQDGVFLVLLQGRIVIDTAQYQYTDVGDVFEVIEYHYIGDGSPDVCNFSYAAGEGFPDLSQYREERSYYSNKGDVKAHLIGAFHQHCHYE